MEGQNSHSNEQDFSVWMRITLMGQPCYVGGRTSPGDHRTIAAHSKKRPSL